MCKEEKQVCKRGDRRLSGECEGNVEGRAHLWGADHSKLLKVEDGILGGAEKGVFALMEEQERVERVKDLGGRLVDGGDDGAAGASDVVQRAHHRQGGVRIKAGRWLVQEDHGRVGDQLASNGDTLALTARDAARRRVADECISAPFKAQHVDDAVHQLLVLGAADRGRQAESGGECDGLAGGLGLKHKVVLHHVCHLARKGGLIGGAELLVVHHQLPLHLSRVIRAKREHP